MNNINQDNEEEINASLTESPNNQSDIVINYLIENVSINLIFHNENNPNIAFITAFIDGKKVYDKGVLHSSQSVGIGGLDSITLEVPDRIFTLKVMERDTGVEETKQINLDNGKYIIIGFYEIEPPRIIINQIKERPRFG